MASLSLKIIIVNGFCIPKIIYTTKAVYVYILNNSVCNKQKQFCNRCI